MCSLGGKKDENFKSKSSVILFWQKRGQNSSTNQISPNMVREAELSDIWYRRHTHST